MLWRCCPGIAICLILCFGNKPALTNTGDLDPRLWTIDAEGEQHLTMPRFEHTSLNDEVKEQRLITLHPSSEDLNSPSNHVRCDLETVSLNVAPPFILEVLVQLMMLSCGSPEDGSGHVARS